MGYSARAQGHMESLELGSSSRGVQVAPQGWTDVTGTVDGVLQGSSLLWDQHSGPVSPRPPRLSLQLEAIVSPERFPQ